MGASFWRLGYLGALACVALGCDALSGGQRTAPYSSRANVPEVLPQEAPSNVGDFAHLPRFVDGGIRCEVRRQHMPEPAARSARGSDWEFPLPVVRSLGGRDKVGRCGGLGPLCSILAPLGSMLEPSGPNLRLEQLSPRATFAEESAQESHAARQDEHHSTDAGGRGIYLTNDESLSLASPQRLIWAIDHDAPVPSHLVRPHELLNYFSFTALPVNPGEVFSVLPELSPHPMRPSDYTLGFSVLGRSLSKESRLRTNLTYVLDRSGSMAGGDRIELLKKGVLRSLQELKAGDIVSVIVFDTTTCPLAQNFVVGRDSMPTLRELVRGITPRGGSNLQDGLTQGYETANRSYQSSYSNRVLVLTDVEEIGASYDEKLVRLSARNYDARRVRLSAVGLGDTVSDALLDRLTEAGKGSSMFVSSEAELEAIFGRRFTSLLETVATNVHFRLELPPSIRLRAFYGEEASAQKGRVQAVHFFSGTQQMYLANLEKSRDLSPKDFIRLSIEFDDPETAEPRSSEFSWRADALELATGEKSKFASRNLNKARMVATFGYQLRHMAETYGALAQPPAKATWSVGGVSEPSLQKERSAEAFQHCRRVKGRLDAFSAQLLGEEEAARIVELWRRYCRRFEGGEAHLELIGASHPQGSGAPPITKLVQLDAIRNNDFIPSLDDIDL